jgi:hypothetical protein
MTTAARYLEESKINDLALQLEQQGYNIVGRERYDGMPFDLVASKDGRTIAFEVKARIGDPMSAKEIARMREQAVEQGFDDFRLVVVNPPHETAVEIPGLDELLYAYIAEHHTAELDDLPGAVRVDNIDNLDIDAIEITVDGIHLTGTGTITVEIEHDGGEARDGLSWETDFPFIFDVVLSHTLRIEQAPNFRIDTSSLYE